jgi:hypothetical protein
MPIAVSFSRRKGGPRCDPAGYGTGKRLNGKKWHILVDMLDLLLVAAIDSVSIQDRDGTVPLLRAARRLFPCVKVVSAGGACQGETTADSVAGTGRWRLEIGRRSASPASCSCRSEGS